MFISKDISDKVLIISTSLKGKGGIAMVVNEMSNYYETFNHVATTVQSKYFFKKLECFLTAVSLLLYYIFFRKIKIVHIHGASYVSFFRKMLVIMLCRSFKIKIVYHIHGAEFKLFFKKYNKLGIIKKTIDKTDALIVLSDNWKQYFSAIVDKNRIFVLNNVVNKPVICKNYLKTYSSINYLFLGRIGERKGIYDLLDVVRANKMHLEGKFLLYVGGDGEIDRLTECIVRHKLQNLIKFEGWVSGIKKKELLSICDIYILPSYNEGLPVSILEAMSYGMPIISTNVGGIPDVITENKNGLLINPGDKSELTKSIFYFMENTQEIKRMGMRNMEMIKKFYAENVIPNLNDIYATLLI
jgi:glycosyltransferase involved in cell wall biosynthesis